MLIGDENMKVFFTRRYDDKYKYSIYYLEGQKHMVCRASRTVFSLTHKLSLEENGVEKYRLVRTKGNPIVEFLMSPVNNYKSIEFTILMNNTDSIGVVRFKKKNGIELIVNEQKYVLTNHRKGYFSIKDSNKQIALLKREPIAHSYYNRYCVWYEPNISNLMDIFLLLLSVNDYMFYCNDWMYVVEKDVSTELIWKSSEFVTIWPSFKSVIDNEVNWRPSDSNNETNIEDSVYLIKIDSLQKEVNKHSIFVTVLFVIFIFIYIAIAI